MSSYNGMEVAVIGMSGRFPGANTIGDFWNNIKNGVESIRFFDDDDLLEAGEEKRNIDNPLYVKANGNLQDKDCFDAAFFDKRPDEAKITDPQIRLFQQCVWNALEDSGYNPHDYDGKIALFAGGTSNLNWMNYALLTNRDSAVDGLSLKILSNVEFLCSSTSYQFNLRGPSVYIATACSTSLVAIQKAAMSLLLQECSMAIAGGVSVQNRSGKGYLYQDGMIFSRDGHCRAFDKEASGTVASEGAGVVILKRLKDALNDGDQIYAVIKGSGVNNDGYNKAGYTAPGIDGQHEAILKARKMAKIEPETIGLIEAHGTGTLLGDPIEVEALNMAFGKSEKKYCALGSVKTNIGHLDAAAGVTGFIKAVLALRHKQIPPSLNFTELNPKIDFDKSPFYINTTLKDWVRGDSPLRAGVSSFGIGGTNVHVILEEAPLRESSRDGRTTQLLTLSAKTADALKRNAENLKDYLAMHNDVNLSDIAYTLNTSRSSFEYRQALVCTSAADAVVQLSLAGGTVQSVKTDRRSPIVFMFPGQGSQYVNMCRQLFEHEAVFRQEANQCFDIIQRQSGKDIKSVIFQDAKTDQLHQTEYTQPALFIVEYALSRLLMSWGIQPDAMIGHSIGEYVAACLSGVFTLEDALQLVVLRGALMQQMDKGVMLSVLASEAQLQPYLDTHKTISLAAVNSMASCVVSGSESSIAVFAAVLQKAGITHKRINTSHAFHSGMMDGMLPAFEAALNKVSMGPPQISFMSNVSGNRSSHREVSTPVYWVRQLRDTVRFSAGLSNLMREHDTAIFLEVGPGSTLSSFAGANIGNDAAHRTVCLLSKASEEDTSLHHVLLATGKLWAQGVSPDWKLFYNTQKRQRVSLPGYSFEKTRYPADVDAEALIMEALAGNGGVKKNLEDWFYVPAWESSRLDQKPFSEQVKKLTLIFPDAHNVAHTIGHRLARTGADVHFMSLENGDDYETILSELTPSDIPVRVIFAGGINDVPEGDAISSVRHQLDRGFYTLLAITRALSKFLPGRPVEIISVTSNLHAVLRGEWTRPEKSPLLGLIKVIPKEYKNFTCKNIDIGHIPAMDDSALLDDILTEILSDEPGPAIAIRHGNRFVQTVKARRIPQPDFPSKAEYPFVAGEVYLITGGTGGLGLSFARQICAHASGVTLVLMGRTVLPENSEWTQWLETHDNEADKYAIVQALNSMNKDGNTIIYQAVDLSDAVALESCIRGIEALKGPVRGVIHTAGIADTAGIMHRRSREDNDAVMSPKIDGTLALQSAFRNQSLDFFVLCSSLSSILAPFGEVGYVASNIFMESLAGGSQNSNSPMISIAWNQWREVGMAAGGLIRKGQSYSENSISPEEGYDVLIRSLTARLPEVFISNSDPKFFTAFAEKEVDVVSSRKVAEVKEHGAESIEGALVRIWSAFFGKSAMGVDADFYELGGDSLKALTLLARVNQDLGCDLALSAFMENPTIHQLAVQLSFDNSDSSRHRHHSIASASRKDSYPLSSSQRRLYFLHRLEPSSVAYNMPQVVRLQGVPDDVRMMSALCALVSRHESLRTSFHTDNDTAFQRIAPSADFVIEHIKCDHADGDSAIRDFIRPFDLSAAPLLRARLITLAGEEHLLAVDMHHIISDGVSQSILIKDFMSLYKGDQLPALSLHYKDYAEWQQSPEQQASLQAQRQFWVQQFEEAPVPLDLPTDYQRPLEKTFAGNNKSFQLTKDETKGIKAIGLDNGATTFMVILSAFNILLSKLCNQGDITVGTPVSNREHAGLESVIGMFVNTMIMRNKVSGDLTFREFLDNVRTKTMSCFENGVYPYDELISELQVTRDSGRNPLFDVMLVFQNFEQGDLAIPGLTLSPYGNVHQVSKFDLTLYVAEANEELHLTVEYATDLFCENTIEKFVAYFKKIIQDILINPDRKIAGVSLLSEEDRRTLLQDFNDTNQPYPRHTTIVDLFEEQVLSTPDNVAVYYGDEALTYGELKDKSDRIAWYLQTQSGVQTGDLVGLLLEREEEMMPFIFGILKSGAVYVPLSPEYPAARINTIVADARLKLLVSRTRYAKELSTDPQTTLLNLDQTTDRIYEMSAPMRLTRAAGGNDLAYVIHTSGSTGNPKGVMIEHHALVNRLLWMQKKYPLEEKDVLLQKTPLIFDVSVWELFWWTLAGASVCILPATAEKEPAKVMEAIERYNVTHIHFVPSMLSVFLEDTARRDEGQLNVLRKVFSSGEALTQDQVARFGQTLHKKYKTRLINLYGPTEATVDVSYYECDFSNQVSVIPIGKPIDNIKLHILDRDDNLCPVGVAGELYIEGAGIARGYLHNERLTREKFTPHPFDPAKIIYRTGDLACWLPDGNIRYFGRLDQQVKIRGFRIELGEIERQLAFRQDITDAVVTVHEHNGHKHLVAYYVSAFILSSHALQKQLAASLPEYMVPGLFVRMDALPLTPTGKIDRKKLPQPAIESGERYVAPVGEKEEILAVIWSEVLGVELTSVGVTSSFFDLGGHSLIATVLINRIAQRFMVELSLKDIFSRQTIRQQGEFIELNNWLEDTEVSSDKVTEITV